MTTLLLIRHGQSESNITGTFTGQLDTLLTELGHRQAAQTALYLAQNYSIDAVYASDLRRAYDTGKALADLLGLPVTAHKGLREIWGGQWEGTAFQSLNALYPESYATVWRKDIGHGACDGGETVARMQQRVAAAVAEITAENPGKTVAIATHATPIRALECLYRGVGLAGMKDIPWVTNASVTQVQYDRGSYRVVRSSYDAHLGDITTALPQFV